MHFQGDPHLNHEFQQAQADRTRERRDQRLSGHTLGDDLWRLGALLVHAARRCIAFVRRPLAGG